MPKRQREDEENWHARDSEGPRQFLDVEAAEAGEEEEEEIDSEEEGKYTIFARIFMIDSLTIV